MIQLIQVRLLLRTLVAALLFTTTLLAQNGILPRGQEDGLPPGQLVGQVLEQERKQLLPGVEVVALFEGVTLAGSAVTGEDGRFSIEVPAGEYDLRVVSPDLPLQAGIARDIRVDPGGAPSTNFELRTIELGLRDLGIDPEWLADVDADGVPDRAERATASNHESADTNEDGVADGLGAWVGAHPKLGPPHSYATPYVIWPAPAEVLPLLDAVPHELLFHPVPGATGYRLRVESVDEELADETDHDLVAGELLLGEECALRWSPPEEFIPGDYKLIVRGYYGAPGEWVGKEAERTFGLVGVGDLEPVVFDDELELSGFVLATSVHITKDARLSVPPGEWLRILATEELFMEEEALLVGAPGEGDDAAADIHISCGGDVRVFGAILTGAGAPGQDVHVPPSGSGSPSTAIATPGRAAGDLVLSIRGKLTVGREALLATGPGGRGGNARAEADSTYDALAVAGQGGRGGGLVVHAGELVVAERGGRLFPGPGGVGGDAEARGGDGGFGERAGLSSALPGVGGDAGDLWISHLDLRGDGFVALYDPRFPVAGGFAGDVGAANSIQPEPGQAKGQVSLAGRIHEVHCAEAGGGGWRFGGPGQTAVAQGGAGFNSGAGGPADAASGPGGPVRRIGISYPTSRLVFGFLPTGGSGGLARAIGGAPGYGTTTAHGAGGSARAFAGAGGAGLGWPSTLLSRGGEGGLAEAFGAEGLEGADRCPKTGQDGSDGGAATSIGGAGGMANGLGGNGGAARAIGASAGHGGRGIPAGFGGKGGDGNATPGLLGQGLLVDGAPGLIEPEHGALGQSGEDCP